jgi:signal transduction histidine kinase
MQHQSIEMVLIIEDNPGDARLLREMLHEEGLSPTVTYAGTMVEAEESLANAQFDVVLLDLGLPDAQGVVAIQRARAAAPHTPLVVLTGMDDPDLATLSLQQGVQDYLVKGQIEARALSRALRYAIERKRMDRLKDEFVSTVSHELRTPLTSITASLGLLTGQSGISLPPQFARLLEIAHTNSQRFVRLVNDILDIEKLESGQVRFELEKTELKAVAEKASESLIAFAQTNRVRLKIEDPSQVPLFVRADPDRLAQVVVNLLSNAVKFSPPDGEVAIKIYRHGDGARLSVRDQGSGVPSEFRTRIFDRFAQADATNTRQKGGSGLGLSIVKQIVDRLGGTVGFLDAPGGGTVFYVELPIWEGKADLEVIAKAEAVTLARSSRPPATQAVAVGRAHSNLNSVPYHQPTRVILP